MKGSDLSSTSFWQKQTLKTDSKFTNIIIYSKHVFYSENTSFKCDYYQNLFTSFRCK